MGGAGDGKFACPEDDAIDSDGQERIPQGNLEIPDHSSHQGAFEPTKVLHHQISYDLFEFHKAILSLAPEIRTCS